MVDTNFTLVSGTYDSEQILAQELDYFITETISGWTRLKEVTDSASDSDVVYYTDGSVPGFYDRMYVRVQGTSDTLQFNVLSGFDTISDTDIDGIGGTSNQTELLVGTVSGTYWFIGSSDAIHIVVNSDQDGPLHGGFGLWDTYYSRLEDPKPFYVFGQTAQSQTFASALRLESYGPRSWGKSMSAAASGTGRAYEALHPSGLTQGAPNPRSGEPKFMEPVFYTDQTYPYYEVRGEVPGLFMCGGTPYSHGNVVTVTGTPGTISGSYFIHKHTDAETWALGPVLTTATGTSPYLFGTLASGIVCHLTTTSGITAEFTVSGTVSAWADLSGNSNDWSQSTESKRPFLYENIQNSLPAVYFDGADDAIEVSAFISGGTPGEVFVALQNTRDASTEDGLWTFGSSGSDSNYTYTDDEIYDTFGSTSRKTTNVDSTTLSPRVWHVYNARSDSGSWVCHRNQLELYSTGSNTVGWAATFLFGESPGVNWGGYLGELVVYDRILTVSERRQVVRYLLDRWESQ